MSDSTTDALLQTVKSHLARRLKYARNNHPNGPMTQAALAGATGVSVRALADIEAGSSNPSLDTLIKLARGFGFERVAYFLDEAVFEETNKQLESLRETAEAMELLGATAVTFRAPAEPDLSEMDMSSILRHLKVVVEAAERRANTGKPDGGSPQP